MTQDQIDPDRSLARRAMRAEMLDAETEATLARAWRDQGDEAALSRFITAYLRLAVSMASKYKRYGATTGDLIQQANLGLMQAADRFDPDKGVRFSTYAMWWIKAELQSHVMRDWSLVRTGASHGQKTLFFNMSRVRAQLDREAAAAGEAPSGTELRARIAARLNVRLDEVETMEGRMSGPDMSLDAPQSGDEDGRAWVDVLPDDGPTSAEQVDHARDAATLRGWLRRAMQGLSDRERYVLRERRLVAQPRTLADLGAELGLSKERVRQIEAASFAKMRGVLAQHGEALRPFLG